jgi:hypothetical protein
MGDAIFSTSFQTSSDHSSIFSRFSIHAFDMQYLACVHVEGEILRRVFLAFAFGAKMG